MNYTPKLEPRSCVVLCLSVEVNIVELRYELECISHLVEKKRKKNLANAIVELLVLSNGIGLSVYVGRIAVGQNVVGVSREETSKIEHWSEPARVVCGSCECIVVAKINKIIARIYNFRYAFVAALEKVVQVEPY